jgi:hypothetical protein
MSDDVATVKVDLIRELSLVGSPLGAQFIRLLTDDQIKQMFSKYKEMKSADRVDTILKSAGICFISPESRSRFIEIDRRVTTLLSSQ